jgi:hypothetical protein
MEFRAQQLPPTTTGIIQSDWTQLPGALPYGAHAIGGGANVGQVLSVPAGYSDPIMASHAGQEGWKWSSPAFPASFQLIPRLTGFSVALAATATWYTDNALLPLGGPPSAPAAGDAIWKITKTDGTLLGFLVKSGADGSLRWVVRTLVVVAGDLPNVTLNFNSALWPASWVGSWSGALDPVVSP